MKSQCSHCYKFFDRTPDNRTAFCPPCRVKIMDDGAAAEIYQTQITNGDINVKPLNEADRKRVKAAIRRRLTGSPDCQFKHARKSQ